MNCEYSIFWREDNIYFQVHHSIILELNIESYRLEQSQRKGGKKNRHE